MYILFILIILNFEKGKGLGTNTNNSEQKYPAMPMMCGNQSHFKYFSYCEECAISGCDVDTVFYCSKCQSDRKNTHIAHRNQVMYLDDPKFTEPLSRLKEIIFKQVQSMKLKIEQQKKENPLNFNQILNRLMKDKVHLLKLIDQKEKLANLLMNVEIMKWLLQIKFWEGRSNTSLIQHQSRIKSDISKKILSNDNQVAEILSTIVPKVKQDNFTIDLPQINGQIVQRQIEKLSIENNYMKKQLEICNLVIKLFTSFNSQQLWETEAQCNQLLRKYPDSKVLYLSLIRINELLADGNKEIPRILQQIIKNVDPSFESTDIYHYYMAMAQWQLIEEDEKQDDLIFFQLKNKRFYKLVNPDAYISSLNKAIAVRQKPSYYISLGIGFVVKQNYREALRVFKQASSDLNRRNDALDLNKFWAEIKYDSNQLEFESIMQQLETRTLQFIVNICKYFKNSKNYIQLVQCCEQLISRQPQRSNFKIHFIKSILSYSSTIHQFGQYDHQRLSRAEIMIIDLKRAEEKEASKLQKRLTRFKAQHQFKHQNFMEASEGFEALTKGTNLTTGSDYYNYAASLFKVFMQQQCTEEAEIKQAYENINKALKLKPNNIKYKKLKFFVCSYMNLFNQANKTYEELKELSPQQINSEEYERLIEFVKDNMEVEIQTNDY